MANNASSTLGIPDDRLEGSFILVAREDERGVAPIHVASPFPATEPAAHPSTMEGYVPGSIPSASAHNWSPSLSGNNLSVSGTHLVDSWGRVCLPRGVNLSGSSKTPVNHDPSIFPAKHADVTFVGRPFALEDAPEHFARLRRWGLTLVRLLVTWESLEHAGPGQYDTEYLAYLSSLIKIMDSFGLICIVSMHQDVWSRYSGGSGAPAWTLDAVGFDLHKLEETGAAYLGGVREPGVEHVKGRWPTGYLKLAAATMWTCFWAGDAFAPKLRVTDSRGNEVGIQTFLQSSFMDCFENLARKLGKLQGVLGFEVLNEPHAGYINLPSLHEFNYYTELHFHDTPSALQSFALGAGYTTSIPHYTRSWPVPTKLSHHVAANEGNVCVWRAGRCLWEWHGVWGWDVKKQEAVVLRESYFSKHPLTGEKVDWYEDCWYPFISEWASRVHAAAGDKKLLFVEGIPNEFCPTSWVAKNRPKNMVFAPHWYDLDSLFNKSFGSLTVNVQGLSRGMFLLRALYWGHKGARENYRQQISNMVVKAHESLEYSVPVVIGECGIPMDMNNSDAFRTQNFKWQERAMDALMHALERTVVGFTLWNYNPDNNDTHGDFWNGENFSWFSHSRARKEGEGSLAQDDASLDEGARLLDVIVRPYPAKVAGIPASFDYESDTGAFTFKYRNRLLEENGNEQGNADPKCFETEIFVPTSLAHGRRMIVTAADAPESFTYDQARQTLFVVHRNTRPGVNHTVHVAFDPPLQRRLARSSKGPLLYLIGFVVLLLAIALGRSARG